MNTLITDRLHSVLASSKPLPVVNIQSHRKLTDQHFFVTFASTDVVSRKWSYDDFNAAMAMTTDNVFTLLPDSLYTIEGPHVPMYRAIAVANNKTMEYSDTELANNHMKVVTANVFQDDDDAMWRLVGEGEGRHLVQISAENFDALLQSKKQMNRVVASYSPIVEYKDGDYVLFFNQATAGLDFGFMQCSDKGLHYVLSRHSGKQINVLPDQIVEAAFIEGIEDDKGGRHLSPAVWKTVALADRKFSAQAYLDYMRTMFGGTKFFQALEAAIRKNSVA